MYSKKKKKERCTDCKKITSFLDLAFKNHQLGRKDIGYSRNPQDWTYLCRSCHMIADGRIKNLKQYEGD